VIAAGWTLVVAGVIRDRRGRVLVARRPEGRHMAGLWEFPGGKVRPGEGPSAALERELAEELGVTTHAARPLTFAVHTEPGLQVLLLFYEVELPSGQAPRALDGQELAWVEPVRLAELAMPPADRELVARLAGQSPR